MLYRLQTSSRPKSSGRSQHKLRREVGTRQRHCCQRFRFAAVGEVRLGICIQLNTPPVYLLTFNVLTACVHAHFQTRFFFFLAGTVPTRCIRLYTVYCTNTVDGPLSANSYTQSLRATVGKLGTMSRACLFTEFMMLQWNVHRGIDHDEKQAFNVNIRA